MGYQRKRASAVHQGASVEVRGISHCATTTVVECDRLTLTCVRSMPSRPTDPAISVECAQITSQTQLVLQPAATEAKGKTVADLAKQGEQQSFWSFLGSVAVYLVAHYVCSKILVGVEEGEQ